MPADEDSGSGASRLDGHHIGGGRNVIPAGQGHAGRDIFFAAVQMSRMPMLLTDPATPDNVIVFCNQAFEKLTGYTRNEIVGRNCRFLQGPDTDPAAIARLREGIARRHDIHEEILNYRRDGSTYWNALFISPVTDPDGNLLYFFASQLDVTRKREAEAQLQQSQRMEALGSMASSVAHEFNNLMTVVVGSLSQLQRQGLDARGREQLERALWATAQAGRVTQQMLSFARRQFHDTRLVDLNEVVRGLDSLIGQVGSGHAGAAVEVAFALTTEALPVRLDPGQLELAVLNLVRNAMDALPQGGTITLRTVRGPGDAWLSVADTGTGMTDDVARRATDPFFTTKPKGQGTGLGLSMVAGFVAQSNGRLAIQTAPQQGTEMRLHFPLDAGAGPAGAVP